MFQPALLDDPGVYNKVFKLPGWKWGAYDFEKSWLADLERIWTDFLL